VAVSPNARPDDSLSTLSDDDWTVTDLVVRRSSCGA
jgi:hypothetical protein